MTIPENTSTVINKPVHSILHKTTEMQVKEARKELLEGNVILKQPKPLSLPVEVKESRSYLGSANDRGKSPAHKTRAKVKLKVWYSRVPPIPENKKPDCGSCVTSACCKAFLVALAKDEYDSGLYEEYAVKLTREAAEQLKKSNMHRYTMLQMGGALHKDKDVQYFLEGTVGQACPYLGEDSKCTIYEDRPLVCRTYTCVDDSRITDGMRAGTERVKGEFLHDTE